MEKKLFWTSIVSAIVGLLVATYMTIYKIVDNDVMCLGSGDCAVVNASKYSEIFGIPVALFGMIGFVSILFVHYVEKRQAFLREHGTILIFGMSLVGFLFTLYLTYLEFFVIHAICPFCVASGIAITVVFIIAIIRMLREQPE